MDEQTAQQQLNITRQEWNNRAAAWNERSLQSWATPETAAWWATWLADLRPYLPDSGLDVTLLDAGSGNGQLSILYTQAGYQVSGCDLSSEMVNFATENAARANLPQPIEFTVASVDDTPYADGQFDIVNCRCVYDFTPRPAYTLRELRRVTKAGGVLVLGMMGANSPVKYKRWQRWLHGLDPIAEQFTDIFSGVTPWETEKLLPVVGWRLLHQQGGYGPAGSGATNDFADFDMGNEPIFFQQAAATVWLMVAEAVEPQPLEES